MSKVAIQGNASGTGTLTIAAPNTNTDRTLTLPDEAGTVLTTASTTVLPKGVPAFHAYLSGGNQSITTASTTKVALNTVSYDTHSFFDTANYRFLPTIAGYYFITGSIYFSYTGSVGNTTWTRIYKNAATEIVVERNSGYNHYGSLAASAIIYLNGSTDFVELFGYYGAVTNGVFVSSATGFDTKMFGCLVRAD